MNNKVSKIDYNDGSKNLTKNDKCFFALSFYRQAVTDAFRGSFRSDSERGYQLAQQAVYWWNLYLERRKESRNK